MLPAPTTTSPASSTALIGARRRCSAAWKACGVSAGSNGSAPSRGSSVAAGAACSEGDQTTAPKRRGSFRRSVPRSVTRSKWSCGPGAGACGQQRQRARHAQVQQQPAVIAAVAGTAPPACSGSQRYLPRRVTSPTVRPTRASRGAAERPAQRLAQPGRQHAGTAQRGGNAAPGDLDLGQFGHGLIM